MLTLEPIDDGLGLTWNGPDAAQLPFPNGWTANLLAATSTAQFATADNEPTRRSCPPSRDVGCMEKGQRREFLGTTEAG